MSVAKKNRRHPVLRAAVVLAGVVLSLAGIALLVLPGPGAATLLAGLILLGEESPRVRALVKHLRRAARRALRRRRDRGEPMTAPLPSPPEGPPGAHRFGRAPERPVPS